MAIARGGGVGADVGAIGGCFFAAYGSSPANRNPRRERQTALFFETRERTDRRTEGRRSGRVGCRGPGRGAFYPGQVGGI